MFLEGNFLTLPQVKLFEKVFFFLRTVIFSTVSKAKNMIRTTIEVHEYFITQT